MLLKGWLLSDKSLGSNEECDPNECLDGLVVSIPPIDPGDFDVWDRGFDFVVIARISTDKKFSLGLGTSIFLCIVVL